MRKFLILIVALTLSAQAFAQRGQSDRQSGRSFAERVWFGVNLNDLSFGNRTFSFGLTPMAAVDLSEVVSMGIMFKASYYYENLVRQPPKIKFEAFDFGPGIFTRFRVMDQFFAQIEYERAFLDRPQYDSGGFPIIENNEVLTESLEQNYVYVGGGLSQGGRVRYTLSVHYNILDDIEYVRIPWDVRGGITWYLK
jgi:hypothetical protein